MYFWYQDTVDDVIALPDVPSEEPGAASASESSARPAESDVGERRSSEKIAQGIVTGKCRYRSARKSLSPFI